MKKLYNYIAILLVALTGLCACSEELDVMTVETEGTPVQVKLSYKALLPDVVSTRATDAEEKALKELHVFVFSADAEGKLKGYKKITENLKQDGTKGTFTIKTTTGDCYIYGVANTSASYYKAEDFIGTAWTEDDAQAGNIDFTREEFLQKSYSMGEDDCIYMYSPIFTMSGSMNDGALFTISVNSDGTTGSVSITDPTIELKRVVSKVNFTFGVPENNTNEVEFTLTKYDICSVPTTIPLFEGGNLPSGTSVVYKDIKGIVPSTQNKNQIKDIYLPENLNVASTVIDTWKNREVNTYADGVKSFTNAPDNSTYIVAYGEYTDNTGKVANVEYTIHLGDFSSTTISDESVKFSNFENQRNYRYSYGVKVHGVEDIIAEAQVDTDNPDPWNPATEGIVLDPVAGKIYTLDSHYESCVMQFSQSQIQELIAAGSGYVFQVETFGKKSEVVTVTDKYMAGISKNEMTEDQVNAIDHSWVTFAQGGTYSSTNEKGGTPLSYTNSGTLYSVPELLKYLYSIANDASQWNNGTLTFTCYVEENYYEDKLWSEYTNISPRVLFIANDVAISDDSKSVYAKVAYGIRQRAIQTIYNMDKANNIIAFGCETVDETYTGNNYSTNYTGSVGTFDGRTDMINALYYNNDWKRQNSIQYTWDSDTYNTYAAKACMTRNRDLNRDGNITRDEVRWYIPSYEQMAGLWIGEEGISDANARLYTKNTSDLDRDNGNDDSNDCMHYFTNTSNRMTFWAEEGSSFGNGGNNEKYIKCVRNLQSNSTGVEAQGTSLNSTSNVVESNPYYNFDTTNKTFDLTNLNNAALRGGTLQNGELGKHNERQPGNKPRSVFKVASSNLSTSATITLANVVEENPSVYCNGIHDEGGKEYWRVPNQRELCLMVIKQSDLTLTLPDNHRQGGYFARTQFSNPEYRYGYGYGRYNIGDDIYFRMYIEDLNDEVGFIRCVRDIEE